MPVNHPLSKGNGSVLVLVAILSGCTLFSTSPGPNCPGNAEMQSSSPATQPAQATSQTPPASCAGAERPALPAVNLFGELEGTGPLASAQLPNLSLQQHTTCDEGYDADVCVDPKGQWLLFASTRHSEQPDIYLQRIGGSSVIQLTSDPASDVQPTFSPDGKSIAFCSNRSGNWDIYLMDADGKNVRQLTNGASQDMHPSFSPDGRRLVFCSLSPRSNQWELWVMDLNTLQQKTIGPGLFPAWSPRKDVDRIAFQRPRQRGSRWFSVWTVDLVQGEPTRLTEVAFSHLAAAVTPSWSPDGRHLVFATVSDPTGRGGQASRHDIWIVEADGGSRQRLTEGLNLNICPVWAVDNRVYFISDRGGQENIWSVQVFGSGQATAAAEKHPASEAAGHAASPATPARLPEPSGSAIGSVDAHGTGH